MEINKGDYLILDGSTNLIRVVEFDGKFYPLDMESATIISELRFDSPENLLKYFQKILGHKVDVLYV